MHIDPPLSNNTIFNKNESYLAKAVWERLDPAGWPLSVDQFPFGSALVGGAVRDGLLKRLGKRPDIDFVVPENAIKLAKKLASSLGATCVVLDAERDIARLIFKGWSFDLAKQIGNSLEEDLLKRYLGEKNEFRRVIIELLLLLNRTFLSNLLNGENMLKINRRDIQEFAII